jgi:hypothetical protein
MSTRTYMLSLKSIEPIRKAVGSKDPALLEALVQKIGEDEDFQSYAEDMIMGSPPEEEPGCWHYLVEPLAQHFDLSPKRLPLDDWKHYHVWEDYRRLANSHLSKEAKRLLKFLEVGRPFAGSSVQGDPCMFAWLTTAETKILLDELAAIDPEEFGELDEFHEELVESLQETVGRGADLFLGAQ